MIRLKIKAIAIDKNNNEQEVDIILKVKHQRLEKINDVEKISGSILAINDECDFEFDAIPPFSEW